MSSRLYGSSQRIQTTATVLSVEDDIAILEGIADLLEIASAQFEIEVVKAHHGLDALDKLSEQVPDLIISDVAMPFMNGYELLEEVRSRPEWTEIPFIFLTAQSSEQQIYQGLKRGVELYITKPFDSNELVELVESQLNRALKTRATHEKKVDDLKKELSRTLQHEFRTPLTFVTAYLEFLNFGVEEDGDADELREHLHGIQSGNERLMRLVTDLIRVLDLRSGHGTAEIHSNAGPIDNLGDILERAVEHWSAEAASIGATMTLRPIPDIRPIFGCPACVQEVFNRLLDNAVKFTKANNGKQIDVWVESHADRATLHIKDTGIGFPNNIRNRLFDLFYQHDRNHWEQQGPGVGLTIIKELVEMHNGYIELEGIPNEGAHISVTLPYIMGPNPSLAAGNVMTGKRTVSLMLVEDDANLLEGLEDLLMFSDAAYEYDVMTATNGEEAIKLLRRRIPDLILSDIMMPRLDGYGLLERIRATPEWAEIPVIFLSAKGEHKDIHRGRALGVDEYIPKPYDSDYLLTMIATRLDRHFKKQQVRMQDFDLLKEGVLASIEVNMVNSLENISQYSAEMGKLLSGGDSLETSNSADELRRSLRGIQDSSSQLSEFVRNATALVELRTGVVQADFAKRAGMIESITDIIRSTVGNLRDQAEFALQASPNSDVVIDIDGPRFLPPIHGHRKSLETAFARWIQFNQLYCVSSAESRITVHISTDDVTVDTRLTVHNSQLDANTAAIVAKWINTKNAPALELELGATNLMIFREYMDLHSATIAFHPGENEHSFDVSFNVYDPFI